MRLKRNQKTAVLAWIAEGLQSDEINERAAGFEPPFHVDRQQVDYYRKTRRIDLDAIAAISEKTALVEGYARREHRVYKLSLLAALMEKDLFGGFLWTEEVKGVGSGEAAEVIDYEAFNGAEVVQYRGVLDDIAKEMGDRKDKPGDTVVNVAFDLNEWKSKRQSRLSAVEALKDEECGTQDPQG